MSLVGCFSGVVVRVWELLCFLGFGLDSCTYFVMGGFCSCYDLFRLFGWLWLFYVLFVLVLMLMVFDCGFYTVILGLLFDLCWLVCFVCYF